MVTKKDRKLRVSLAALALALSACGPIVTSEVGTGGGALTPNQASMLAFERTLYPLLRQNCANCHIPTTSEGAEAFPFADTNLSTAYGAILGGEPPRADLGDPPNSKAVIKVAGGHNGIDTALSNTLVEAIESWKAEVARFGVINTGGNRIDTVLNQALVLTNVVTVPADFDTNLTYRNGTASPNCANGAPLTFSTIKGLPGASIVVCLAPIVSANVVDTTTYAITRIRVTSPANQNIRVRGLDMLLNRKFSISLGTYKYIDSVVLANAAGQNISTSQVFFSRETGPNGDTLQLAFEDLRTTTETVGVTANFRTMRTALQANCVGCHSGVGGGGYDFSGLVAATPADFLAYQYTKGDVRRLVVLGNPNASSLWMTIQNAPIGGRSVMPQNQPDGAARMSLQNGYFRPWLRSVGAAP